MNTQCLGRAYKTRKIKVEVNIKLLQSAGQAPIKVSPRRPPSHSVCDAALGLHSTSSVLKVSKLDRNLMADRSHKLVTPICFLLRLLALLDGQGWVLNFLQQLVDGPGVSAASSPPPRKRWEGIRHSPHDTWDQYGTLCWIFLPFC